MYPIANPKTTDYNPPLNGGGIGVAGDEIKKQPENDEDLLTTKDVAILLKIKDVERVRQLIRDEIIPARKLGRDYVIRRGDLKGIKPRPVGRPPKPESD